MSTIPAVTDRTTIEQELKEKIEQVQKYEDKIKLIALNYYLQQKKLLDSETENKIKELEVVMSKQAKEIQLEMGRIINGEKELGEDELKEIDLYLDEQELANKNEINNKLNSDPISGYWFKSLKNCPMLRKEIKPKDESVLKHLTKIEYSSELLTFYLDFVFEENDFFHNKKLRKNFKLKDVEEPYSADGDQIEWKEGKDVTKKTVKKKEKNKKTGKIRTATKEIEDQSFFNFFKPVILQEGQGQTEKVTEETKAILEEKMAIQYDIARAIIDELLPYSLEYYLGVRDENILQTNKKLQEDSDEEQDGDKLKQNLENQMGNECKQQ